MLSNFLLFYQALGVQIIDCRERYLGLPTVAGRNRTHIFYHVRDLLWRKLHVWNAKLLSSAGKEVLIKAAAQALPTYTHGLSSMIARYWWEKQGNKVQIG